MNNYLRMCVSGPGLLQDILVVGFILSYSSDTDKVTLDMTDHEGHHSRVVVAREEAHLYTVTQTEGMTTKSFTMATIMDNVHLGEPNTDDETNEEGEQ